MQCMRCRLLTVISTKKSVKQVDLPVCHTRRNIVTVKTAGKCDIRCVISRPPTHACYKSQISSVNMYSMIKIAIKTGHLHSAFREYLFTYLFICNKLRMARVNEGSQIFTCHSHVYPRMEWAILRGEDGHPSHFTNRPIVRRPGIELATIESKVRRPDH